MTNFKEGPFLPTSHQGVFPKTPTWIGLNSGTQLVTENIKGSSTISDKKFILFLNYDDLYYYPLIVHIDIYDERCDTLNKLFDKVSVSNKIRRHKCKNV